MTSLPPSPAHHALADARLDAFHVDTVKRIAEAVATHPIVVVGMAWNANCPRGVRALEGAGHKVEYIEIGNYVTGWRERLALKLWAGWPTFPQVFVKGQLLGGADQAEAAVKSGELARMLAAG